MVVTGRKAPRWHCLPVRFAFARQRFMCQATHGVTISAASVLLRVTSPVSRLRRFPDFREVPLQKYRERFIGDHLVPGSVSGLGLSSLGLRLSLFSE